MCVGPLITICLVHTYRRAKVPQTSALLHRCSKIPIREMRDGPGDRGEWRRNFALRATTQHDSSTICGGFNCHILRGRRSIRRRHSQWSLYRRCWCVHQEQPTLLATTGQQTHKPTWQASSFWWKQYCPFKIVLEIPQRAITQTASPRSNTHVNRGTGATWHQT